MSELKTVSDSMGEMQIPGGAYWGGVTQRGVENYRVGIEKMPIEVIDAIATIKQAAATINNKLDLLSYDKAEIICRVANEIKSGKLDAHFPLNIWQTGSGTTTNMNINEVIANRGNEIAEKNLLHPNDDVNMSQSSNDVFPSAMHIAAYVTIADKLIPSMDNFMDTLKKLIDDNKGVIKCGRTHLQDATPISFSSEITGWYGMIQNTKDMLNISLNKLSMLAMGATAVGTGINSPAGFDTMMADEITKITGRAFITNNNKFHALTSKDAIVFTSGALKALAANMMKIANDVRWLASGPRLGLGEISIPANEPGSSIMPGKVNPTQCEMMTMICTQVMGNDATIGIAASQGNFELNVFMPVMIYNLIQSINLLAEGINSFNEKCASGIVPNKEKMTQNLHNSLMCVTSLNPYIGYDNSAKCAKKAFEENITIKEACLSFGFLNEEKFDEIYKPEEMI